MRAFTINSDERSVQSVQGSINFIRAPYPHIKIGEEGRGRTYIRFPLGKNFAESLLKKTPCIYRGAKIFSISGKCFECGIEMIALPSDPEKRMLHPVEGDSVSTLPITRADVIKTKEKGTLLLVEERDPADRRALVLVKIAAGYRGRTVWDGGVDDVPFPSPGITVLAKGYCAQGAAGRMGGHAERLLIMEPGSMFRVFRGGRTYGSPRRCYVRWDGENLHFEG